MTSTYASGDSRSARPSTPARQLPLHPSTTRRRFAPTPVVATSSAQHPRRAGFFLSTAGTADLRCVRETFIKLRRIAGLEQAGGLPHRASTTCATLRRADAAGLAPRRLDDVARTAAAAVGMAGPPPPGLDLLLPAGRPRAAGARRAAAPRSWSTVMSALAPTMQAFFTERLQGQRQASPNTIAAYRDTFRLLLTFTASGRQDGQRAPSRRSRRRTDRRLPGPPRARARQQHRHPQRAAGGDPLAVQLRRAPHPEHADTIARVLAIPPNAAQSLRHVPIRRGDRRAARRTRPRPLDRPTRPRAAADPCSRPDCASPS